ncbi:autotransporter secretion outer membrane protein TamA [Marinicella litoralis]|uniref:Translocation and assembly module subunit TamA n=2 Tax=Marinicella litoralis TaxID=644220 RepID=A0A4R6XK03_9GAMM|nr:autotransporter secretion outer membrane protein TamA [Marinicella litoralis]
MMWVLVLLSMTSHAMSYKVEVSNDRIKDNVLAFLETKTYDCMAITSTISRQYQDLLSLVQSAAQPFGYFNTEVKVQAPPQANCETITLNINLGPLTIINQSNIQLIENDDKDFIQLISQHELQSGQPLKQLKYERLKAQLLDVANEKFYLDASFTSQKIDAYPEKNQADISLLFKPGPRYKISHVKIEIDEPFLTVDLINKMINLKADQYITQSQLYQLKQKLNSYGYFNQVLFDIDESAKDNATVPLTIKVTPAAKYDYSVGFGYSTDRGAKASFKYNNHRINDRGHQFNSHLNLSQLSNEMATAYKIPSSERPASKWYNIQLGYRDEQTDNVDSQTSKLGFSETRIHNNRWQNINFIDILHETFDTGVEQGESLLVVPGISWSLTDADSLARPSRGFKIQTELKGASEDVLSDASFAQLTLSGKFIHSLGDSNRLLYRAQFGATASSDFDEMPTTYRFFAGGDQSIRGFDYESISPFNASGDLAGGKHLAVGSIEFEHQFAPQWAVAAFTDFGDAFSSQFDFKYSVGAGVRWFSPIGPVRVDVGVPLNQDSTDFRLHVTIGPDL